MVLIPKGCGKRIVLKMERSYLIQYDTTEAVTEIVTNEEIEAQIRVSRRKEILMEMRSVV